LSRHGRPTEWPTALKHARRDVEIAAVGTVPSLRVRQVVAVAVVGGCLAAAVVVGYVDSQPSPCCGNERPYVALYHGPLSRIEAVLARGDGQSFAALAQDPLLLRPSVIRAPGKYAYRAQRPLWGYLAWAGSAGQAELTGWVLAVLTVLSCAAACAIAGLLLLQRGRSPWWSLVVLIVGFQTLTELTPELLAVALLGAGILAWQRDRRVGAVVAFSLAVLTRESMLVAVAALACWDVAHRPERGRDRPRRLALLAVPFLAYSAWIGVLKLRLGDWPFQHSESRLGLPGVGLVESFERTSSPLTLVAFVAIGATLCTIAAALARDDVLTWVVVAFALFTTTLGPAVWLTTSGLDRTLLPLYLFGAVAAVSALRFHVAGARLAALNHPAHGDG